MKFIDFFSGIGGFRLGMEMAGHGCAGHCEIDKFADRSYRAMHEVKGGEWYANDVTGVRPGELPEAGCYCFGFPCQAFSIAGKRLGFSDLRGTLFFEVMRLAKERKPAILFAENVRGLLSHDGGRTFWAIISTMDGMGYDVEWQVLDSKDFGVPQHRERVYIVGHLRGSGGRKVFPVRRGGQEAAEEGNQAAATITTRNYTAYAEGTYAGECRQAQSHGPHKITGGRQGRKVYDMDGTSTTILAHGGDLGGNTGLHAVPVLTPGREEKRQNGRRFKGDGEPMYTLTAQDRHGVGTMQGQNFRIRRLTPRECFRLQGFPDEYFERAAAVCSDSQLYKQAGNSVTVNVVYEIARRL